MKRQRAQEQVAVFLSEDHRPWQMERAKQVEAFVVCTRMEATVAVVVATPGWLASKRSVEYLFVLAQARHVDVVSFEWVLQCDPAGPVAPLKPHLLRDATLEAAARGAATLLAGHLVVPSRQLPEASEAAAGDGEALRGSRSGLRLGALGFRDVSLLALLHGAEVADPWSLPLPVHRGFSGPHVAAVRELAPARAPGARPACHVLVPAMDAVSKLGLDIYASFAPGFRPVLVEWLVLTLQNQSLANSDRFAVY